MASTGWTDPGAMKNIAAPYGLELLGPLPAPSGSDGSEGNS
jgi:hypothetical protein